ncbi:MAG TPA: hypothetical protein VI793_19810 [Anaerolineales bacterium]|nr:hypothetical protein [Anaerolineales bacterium]
MPSETLTPVEEEFLDLVERECEENGLAVGVFNVGVVMGGMAYSVAYEAFISLRKKKMIRARKLRNQQGQPWAIERETS